MASLTNVRAGVEWRPAHARREWRRAVRLVALALTAIIVLAFACSDDSANALALARTDPLANPDRNLGSHSRADLDSHALSYAGAHRHARVLPHVHADPQSRPRILPSPLRLQPSRLRIRLYLPPPTRPPLRTPPFPRRRLPRYPHQCRLPLPRLRTRPCRRRRSTPHWQTTRPCWSRRHRAIQRGSTSWATA